MNYKLIAGLTLLILFSASVFASDNAPPAIPMEIWGQATVNGGVAADGLAVTAEVDGINYAQVSTTSGGYYNVILVDGDRELTYLDDPTCAAHWPTEACVPCSTNPADEDYCIEGPQDGANVNIKVDSIGAMPYADWVEGSSEEIDITTPIGDWDAAGCVDMVDFTYFANHYGEICTPMVSEQCDIYDVYRDYIIDMVDFTVFANHYGEGC